MPNYSDIHLNRILTVDISMPETLLTLLLFFGLLYLLATSLILVRNRFELTPLPSGSPRPESVPKFSICIPARNEERSIEASVRSACEQAYPDFEVIVLDDQSDDRTPAILRQMKDQYPDRLNVLDGLPKPDQWIGKAWACHQLSDAASGDILVFMDADTSFQPDVLIRMLTGFQKYRLDMLTVWPQQIVKSFWERTLIPMVYYTLVSLLPAIYVYRHPRWMPAWLQKRTATFFAAACGQCIAIHTDAYRQIGGHHSVRDHIVEDVALAKVLKRKGLTMRMFVGPGTVTCRMYHSRHEIMEGFRKNFFAGFGSSIPLFSLASILHTVVFIFPFQALFLSYLHSRPDWFIIAGSSLLLIFSQRIFLSAWFQWNPAYSFTHPVGVIWFQKLGLISLIDHFKGRSVKWKGRQLNT